MNIDIDKIIEYLGEPEKQIGSELFWQCPFCQDSGKDNLKYNQSKEVLWCFANPEHAPQLLSDIAKNRKEVTMNNYIRKEIAPNIIKKEELEANLYFSNLRLLDSEKYLKKLFIKRGITKQTVAKVKLGINANNEWTIPTFKYSTIDRLDITGFEYRPTNLSKDGLYREKGMPSCLAMINTYTEKTEVLAIVEGYFDGYALWQHLNEKGQAPYYHIVTPSNGVNTLLKFMPDIDFSCYKKFYLYIDNDEAGNSMAGKILEQYPMFERIITKCGCKDFNEHYMKCIKATG